MIDVRLLAPIATCLAIVVSVYLWRLSNRKVLSYNILRRSPFLNLKGAARDELDVHYGGHSLIDAYLIVIRIFNSGHQPINPNDYQSNLSIQLNPGAEILAASVIDTEPVDLKDRIKNMPNGQKSLILQRETDRILLAPILLNSSDFMTVQILALNAVGEIRVKGHVHGIKAIRIWKEQRLWPKLLIQMGALVMAFAMLGVQPADILQCRFQHVLPWILIFLVGFVFLQAGLYWPGNGDCKESFSLV